MIIGHGRSLQASFENIFFGQATQIFARYLNGFARPAFVQVVNTSAVFQVESIRIAATAIQAVRGF